MTPEQLAAFPARPLPIEWRVKLPTQKRQPDAPEAAMSTHEQFLEELLQEMGLRYGKHELPAYMQVLRPDDLRPGFFVIAPPNKGYAVPVTGWCFALEDLELYEPAPAVLAA